MKKHINENGIVELKHCATENMVADVMTKALAISYMRNTQCTLLGSAMFKGV
jgi:hypothetical protein